MAIAVDAMGGDFPLIYPVEGAVRAVNDFGIEVILTGDESKINEELRKYQYDSSKISISHCTEVVEMSESPSLALRQKKDSSIRVAVNLHKENRVNAVVTAGHTGAAMTTAKFVLKSIPNIDRPAISTVMPAVEGNFLLLDAGANTDCKPQYLLQFALMGDSYARCLFHLSKPRVGLLSNGEEEGKGNLVVKETFPLLKESTLNFVGNIEGKTMFKGFADVVVCDGFVGNVSLKVAEGTFDFIRNVLKKEISKSIWAKLGYFGMKAPFKELKDRADYTEVGGAPLLGVKGTVIICHGNSKPHTIRNAIRHAQECVSLNLNETISKEVSDNLNLLKEAEKINQNF